ncbi:MAG: LysM peptidoglycan-binding domain-containing protein, partial [Myxococcota bacterium]
LDREALENTGVVIGSPEENMLLSTWDDVYVRYEEGARVQPGREYTIFREIDEEERSPDERGRLVRIFGTVRLRSYDPERGVGRATITEALDPIERGYRIAPIPRRFEMVPPRQNARDVEGRVVATLRPQRLIADQQVVFLNVGEEDGVEVGNRFFVIREGDEWRQNVLSSRLDYGQVYDDAPEPDEDEYPPEVIAEGRVVDVREGTCTVVITASTHEVGVGDLAEMRQSF